MVTKNFLPQCRRTGERGTDVRIRLHMIKKQSLSQFYDIRTPLINNALTQLGELLASFSSRPIVTQHLSFITPPPCTAAIWRDGDTCKEYMLSRATLSHALFEIGITSFTSISHFLSVSHSIFCDERWNFPLTRTQTTATKWVRGGCTVHSTYWWDIACHHSCTADIAHWQG